jgi:hypothetical protein
MSVIDDLYFYCVNPQTETNPRHSSILFIVMTFSRQSLGLLICIS